MTLSHSGRRQYPRHNGGPLLNDKDESRPVPAQITTSSPNTTRRSAQPPSLDPAIRTADDAPLLFVTLVAAASSIAALLLQVFGWVRMPYTLTFVSLPGLVLIVAVLVRTRNTDRHLFFNRLAIGLTAGLVGLVPYDLVRWIVQVVFPVNFDAFAAFPTFGHLMTGQPLHSSTAQMAGWAYHVSNGLTFGVIYTLLAGPARWWWGLLWAACLEAAMLLVYPSLLHPASMTAFVIVSIVGHACFGTTVGLIASRKAMPVLR